MGAIREFELIEGSRHIRDKYINRTEVLDRVKTLSLLPDNETATTEMVAKYYNVPKSTIDSLVEDHRDELVEDGYQVLTAQSLKLFKGSTLKGSNLYNKLKYARQIAIFPRRAILRVGMLLRDSEVAKAIRTYLLNIEENTTIEQKNEARRNWTQEEEMFVLKTIEELILSGKTLSEAINMVSTKVKRTVRAVELRWYGKIKDLASDEVKRKIRENIGKYFKTESAKNDANKFLDKSIQEIIDKVYKENVELKKEIALLRMKIDELERDKERLSKRYKSMKNEYDTLMNIIGSAMRAYANNVLELKSHRR